MALLTDAKEVIQKIVGDLRELDVQGMDTMLITLSDGSGSTALGVTITKDDVVTVEDVS